jgi:hypothetical protein
MNLTLNPRAWMRRWSAVMIAILIVPVHASATPIGPADFSPSAQLVNFDNLTGGNSIFTGDVITNQYAAQGVVFNNPDYPMRANASPIGSNAITDSKPNVAFVQQHDGTQGRPLQLLFDPPVSKVGMQFFTSFGSTITLEAFDSGGHSIESQTLTGTNFGSSAQLLEGFIGLGETTPIAMAQVSSHSTANTVFNFDIDDVRFQGVPEPNCVFLAGMAALGLLARRHFWPRAY